MIDTGAILEEIRYWALVNRIPEAWVNEDIEHMRDQLEDHPPPLDGSAEQMVQWLASWRL